MKVNDRSNEFLRDADRLLRRNKFMVQRGRKTPERRTENGALAPTRETKLDGGGPGASSRV